MTQPETIKSRALRRADVLDDPFALFRLWFSEAASVQTILPEAMSIATVSAEGRPASRMVLLKELDEHGFIFYTNYNSRKAVNLDAVPFAALLFWWPVLERQVRIEGSVEKVSAEDSDAYFATRARGSQLGAWASDQSSPIDENELARRMEAAEERFRDRDVPRPAHWGGYRVIPDQIEFWQGRPNRLHDRFRFVRVDGTWKVDRLAP